MCEYIMKEHRWARYTQLLDTDKLNSYLADIDQRTQGWLDTIIQQLSQIRGIIEELKAIDQMTWVCRMNNVWASVMEIVS